MGCVGIRSYVIVHVMNVNLHPRDLTLALLARSNCNVQVAAVLADNWGIYGWGWNSPGSGYGLHAEAHCLSRSNSRRWGRSTLYVAAKRFRNQKIVTARPCEDCQRLIPRIDKVIYRDSRGEWVEFA